jgi:protein phosphatase
LKEIILPRNTLVLLCGPAGCGKSTFAARHFLPTQIVSSDECRALVSDDPVNQAVSGHAFDLMHFIVDYRLVVGRVWLEFG